MFRPELELATYYACVKILRSAGDYLVVEGGVGVVEDYQYHLATLLGIALTSQDAPEPGHIAPYADQEFSLGTARDLFRIIHEEYTRANRSKKALMLDQLAKDKLITARILERGRAEFGAPRQLQTMSAERTASSSSAGRRTTRRSR